VEEEKERLMQDMLAIFDEYGNREREVKTKSCVHMP
jgi:hypothetical protein